MQKRAIVAEFVCRMRYALPCAMHVFSVLCLLFVTDTKWLQLAAATTRILEFTSGDQINASSGGSNGAGQADPFMYTQRVAPEETMNDADRAATAQSATFATKNGTKLITSALQGIDTKCLLSGTVELPASRLTDERSMGTFGGQELGV